MQNKIINITSTVIFAFIISIVSAKLAYSYSTQDVVLDGNGNKVLTSSGDCARSKWDVGKDRCLDKENPQPSIQVNRKTIGIEERTAYFGFDSSVLTDDEKYKLDVLARTLIEHNVKSVKILGFTDRIGSDSYNYKLSERRAEAVRNYLNSKVTLDTSILIEKGLGKQFQVKICEGKKSKEVIECLRPNRRVVVEMDYVDKH